MVSYIYFIPSYIDLLLIYLSNYNIYLFILLNLLVLCKIMDISCIFVG